MTTLSTTLAAAAPAVPFKPLHRERPLEIVFELSDESWDCDCCGFIHDQGLDLRVNGASVQSWHEDDHFGETRIDWAQAFALAAAYASASLTVMTGDGLPLPLAVPDRALNAPPLPERSHRLVWWTCPLDLPEGYSIERTSVLLDDHLVTVWREDEHVDDPLDEHGPLRCSLEALGALVTLVEHEQEPYDDEDPNEADDDEAFDEPGCGTAVATARS